MSGTATPLSLNEVKFFFTRAAVGVGAPFGIGEDFANASIWLAILGTDPAEAAEPALSGLADGTSNARFVLFDAEGTLHVRSDDGRSLSAIYAGPAIADWLTVEGRKNTGRSVVLEDVDQPALIAAACAAANAANRVTVSWTLADGGQVVIELAEGGTELACPDGAGMPVAGPTDVHIALGTPARTAARSTHPVSTHPLSARIQDGRAQVIESGIEVADAPWSTVFSCFQKCLVPSTAESRIGGAGAGLTDND